MHLNIIMVLSNINRYWGSFFVCGLLCVILHFYGNSINRSTTSSAATAAAGKFSSFQRNYLLVFMLAMFADWLQGPYVYELYVSYGFNQAQIAELFVCGFGSSFVVGTFVGGLADKLGRKMMCIMYCVCYVCGCFTKLVPEYWTLMLGRFLSGISTSLLFSVFESWMVCEHHKQGFDNALIGETFAYATFGNGLVAVVAGLVANYAAKTYGFVAPFVVAIVPLVIVGLLVSTTWAENYGNQQMNMMSSLMKGFDLVRRDSRIAALGMAQSCFEGSMYTFVFMWTPALKTDMETAAELRGEKFPESTSEFLGLIFAVYMISVMIGSSLFKVFSVRRDILYKIPLVLHGIAMFSMIITAFFIDHKDIVYAMFLIFEMTVGLFYPSYGVIKSEKIPEDIRSAVMNIFRMPLNLFVVLLLLKIKLLSPPTVFKICAVAHLVSFCCYLYFYTSSRSYNGANTPKEGKGSIPYGTSKNEEEVALMKDPETV
jgi:MFS transporter, MFS domain-containing protein family, molybdate-anion transporter